MLRFIIAKKCLPSGAKIPVQLEKASPHTHVALERVMPIINMTNPEILAILMKVRRLLLRSSLQ